MIDKGLFISYRLNRIGWHLLVVFVVFVSQNARALEDQYAEKAKSVVAGSLRFLEVSQKTEDGVYWAGEWEVEMTSYFIPAILGVGRLFAKPSQEPTAFATSSIVNLLSEIYKFQPDQKMIPQIVRNGLASTSHYRFGENYNFYNETLYNQVSVRQPLSKTYVPKALLGFTNVPADADTTSVTYLARLQWEPELQIPKSTLKSFSKFRDLDRSPHYFNRIQRLKNTGAFLTWLMDEKDPNAPKSFFAPPEKGARIPFGVNDVDCIVNGNILRLLTTAGHLETPGYKESCDFLNDAVISKRQAVCGIYYPNAWALFYTNSAAYKGGAQCLEPSKEQSIKHLLGSQNEDGSWTNEPGIGRTDAIQSTALAINALLNFSHQDLSERQSVRNSVRAGVIYLLSRARATQNDQFYWPGEVFFSAVAQARNTVLWRSAAYTTALATLALVKAQAMGVDIR